MRKLLLALALALAPSAGWAQCNGVFPANTLCGNLSGSPAPPAAFSAAGTVVGPASSTSGDIATWGNTGGTLLTDSTSFTTNQQLTLTGSLFISGVSSQSNTSISSAAISSTFVYKGFTITFPQSGAAAITSANQTFSGNNTFSGTNSFAGFVGTGPISLSTPLSPFYGGTGRTSFPIVPTVQSFTTGSSQNYVTPTTNPSPSYLIVEMCGGGGGGGAQATNAGTAGTSTTFGGIQVGGWTANPGSGGAAAGGAAGVGGTSGVNGTGTVLLRVQGGNGGVGSSRGAGLGGVGLFGGAALNGGSGNAGLTPVPNTCGGGSGGGTDGTNYGSGGAAGEFVRFQITTPATAYIYTMGTSGTGGAAGTQAGGRGGDGRIIVREFYQ